MTNTNYCDYLLNIRPEWLYNTALVDADSGRRYRYDELQHAVRTLGSNLRDLGFRHGDVLTTHLYNSAEAVIAHLGIQYAGCISCLLDPLVTAEGLAYYVGDTGTKCLITHLDRDKVQEHLPDDVRIIQADELTALGASPRAMR